LKFLCEILEKFMENKVVLCSNGFNGFTLQKSFERFNGTWVEILKADLIVWCNVLALNVEIYYSWNRNDGFFNQNFFWNYSKLHPPNGPHIHVHLISISNLYQVNSRQKVDQSVYPKIHIFFSTSSIWKLSFFGKL
jgi:hypothetical protein